MLCSVMLCLAAKTRADWRIHARVVIASKNRCEKVESVHLSIDIDPCVAFLDTVTSQHMSMIVCLKVSVGIDI
jgi:hypothetical protein